MGDLSGRRGRIAGSESLGISVIIKAAMCPREMLTYANDLISTHRACPYSIEFSHYDYWPRRTCGRRSSAAIRPLTANNSSKKKPSAISSTSHV